MFKISKLLLYVNAILSDCLTHSMITEFISLDDALGWQLDTF